MIHKKIITLLLCFVLCFTFVSAPFRADAAAIAIPATVLGIVGLFVVSAGYTFDSVGDFRTAVTDFCNKNFNMSNGSGFMDILRIKAPDAAGLIELGSVISSEYFPEFWQAIKDFFGGGELEVEVNEELPDGFASYNGTLLPTLTNQDETYDLVNIYNYQIIFLNSDSTQYRIYASKTPFNVYSTTDTHITFRANSSSPTCRMYNFNLDDTSWKYFSYHNGTVTLSYNISLETFSFNSTGGWKFVWSSHDLGTIFKGTSIDYNGAVVNENIPVAVDSTYNPTAVYNGWMSKVQAEPWMTYDATSPVFQDITTAETDKTAPMTVTQTGVLSQGGVKVETDTDVVIPEYNGEYAVNGLTSIFPFCIPFDVYDFFSVLVAEREAPKFDFNLNFGKLGQYPLSVDLTGWDTAATILRTIELLAFCVGLALATSKLIKW